MRRRQCRSPGRDSAGAPWIGCHKARITATLDSPPLPVTENAADGTNPNVTAAGAAREAVPNATDWVNSPIASTCFYCHDSELAGIHMVQNGAVLSVADPAAVWFTQRQDYDAMETCAVCHGARKIADVMEVHGE